MLRQSSAYAMLDDIWHNSCVRLVACSDSKARRLEAFCQPNERKSGSIKDFWLLQPA